MSIFGALVGALIGYAMKGVGIVTGAKMYVGFNRAWTIALGAVLGFLAY